MDLGANNNNSNNNQNTGPEGQGEGLILGKFKSQEDLVAAYQELERKQSTSAPAAPAPAPAPSPAAGTQIDFEGMTNEIVARGELSDASKDRLAKMGIPESVVQMHVANTQKAIADTNAAIHEAAGGEGEYTALIAWAKQSLTPAEKEFYEGKASLGVDSAKLAVTDLKARYEAANGKLPNLTEGQGSNHSGGFQNVEQLKEALRDPRYRKDPAYRADVEAKVRASKGRI